MRRTGDAAFLAGALFLVAALQTIQAFRSPIIQKDGFVFIALAKDLLKDPAQAVRAADQHPGYPAMILAGQRALGWAAGDDPPRAWALGARVFPWIGGLASTWLVWLLARRVFGAPAARIAVIVFATLPLFRRNAADALSDTPCLALYLAAAWCLTEAFARRSVPWIIGAALASGGAYLVRPEGLGAAIVAAALLAAALCRAPTRRFAAAGLCAAAAALGALVAPYVAVKGTLTGKKDVGAFVAAHLGSADDPGGDAARRAGHGDVRGRIAHGIPDLLHTHAADGFRYVLLLPLIAAFVRGRPAYADAAGARIIAALAGMHLAMLAALVLIAGYIGPRHVMISTALAMPWIAAGVLSLGRALARGAAAIAPRAAAAVTDARAAAVLAAALAISFLPRDLAAQHASRIPLLDVASWVRAHTRPSDRVLTTSPFVLFYADREGRELRDRNETLPELRDPAPPYALAVIERDRCGPECRWFAALAARYEPLDAPGVSGGPRRIVLLRPRETP